MSRKLSLVKSVALYLKAVVNLDALYVELHAPTLLALFDALDPADVKTEWSKLNVAAYKANRVEKGDAQYNALAKRASMLLAIGLVDVDLLQDLCDNYSSLQGVYSAVKGKARKAATRKPQTFRQRVVNLLASGTAAQRKMVAQNFKAILAAASK